MSTQGERRSCSTVTGRVPSVRTSRSASTGPAAAKPVDWCIGVTWTLTCTSWQTSRARGSWLVRMDCVWPPSLNLMYLRPVSAPSVSMEAGATYLDVSRCRVYFLVTFPHPISGARVCLPIYVLYPPCCRWRNLWRRRDDGSLQPISVQWCSQVSIVCSLVYV